MIGKSIWKWMHIKAMTICIFFIKYHANWDYIHIKEYLNKF